MPCLPTPQVNNAGIQHVSPVESFPVDKWDDVIAINLSSCFHLIRGTVGGAWRGAEKGATGGKEGKEGGLPLRGLAQRLPVGTACCLLPVPLLSPPTPTTARPHPRAPVSRCQCRHEGQQVRPVRGWRPLTGMRAVQEPAAATAIRHRRSRTAANSLDLPLCLSACLLQHHQRGVGARPRGERQQVGVRRSEARVR